MAVMFFLSLPNGRFVHSFGARTRAIAGTTRIESALSFKSEKAANTWLTKHRAKVILNQLKEATVVVLGEPDEIIEGTTTE